MYNKLYILFIASSKNNGLSFNFVRLAIALKEIGHEVTVVSQPREEEADLFSELKSRKIKCYTFFGLDDLSLRRTIKIARSVGKIIDDNTIDVIHAQGMRQLIVAVFASRVFCRKRPRPSIVTSVHTTLHGTFYENLTTLFESVLLNAFSDLALPVARSVANGLARFGLDRRKIATVHNGVDLNLLDHQLNSAILPILPEDFKQTSRILIGYFAQLIPRKGHKYLIMAISELFKEYPNIRLVLTGSGPLQRSLENFAGELGIKKIVHFTGKIEYKHLYCLLKRIDVYAFPSLAELFPFAILEAMAAGKPVVTTNVGGIPEVINSETGIIVSPHDSRGLATAIRRLINNPAEANRMGKECRKAIEEKFDIAQTAHNLSKCYDLSVEKKF